MEEDGNDTQNFNEICDQMLENLKHAPLFKKLDPFYFDINDDSFKISQGEITGISSIYRHGDVCISTDQENNPHGSLGFGLKNLKYKGKHQVRCAIWLKGEAKIRLSEIKVKIEFSIRNGSASIESLRIIELGNYKMEELSGFTPVLNRLLKGVLNITANILKASIMKRMEKELVKHGNTAIKKLPLPLSKL
ncbi:uncharacterized protein LOC129219332 [Uloborus diversus]|uniref:uncharacterized protein LOC129219332 n=1 Tax=Uloborus diversus TaxID=327109 RepID=UPI0024090D89|nr:uncharacterized protein LOC129219332 [Uloborus diversus]